MNFADMKAACDEFRHQIFHSTSEDYIKPVSTEEPTGAEDELHFFKLVLWCYVFWFEASHPVGKHVGSLLRNTAPVQYKKLDVFRQVQYLRTVRAHNLDASSKDGQYKRSQATAWLITAGGEPTDWQKCCSQLCEDVSETIQLLSEVWSTVTKNPEDARNAVTELKTFVDGELPAHKFDRMIEVAAAGIGFQTFDVVAYRSSRLTRWQELFRLFADKEEAEQALQRAIGCELRDLFGTADRNKS